MSQSSPQDASALGIGCLIMLAMTLYGLAFLGIGIAGSTHLVGVGWTTAIIISCFFFRFGGLYFVIACFFGCKDVLHWPLFGSLCFAFPALPLLIAFLAGNLWDKLKSYR